MLNYLISAAAADSWYHSECSGRVAVPAGHEPLSPTSTVSSSSSLTSAAGDHCYQQQRGRQILEDFEIEQIIW
jgi:hypothetical protein